MFFFRNVFGSNAGPIERRHPGGVVEQIFEGFKVRISAMPKIVTVYQRKLQNSPTPPPPPPPRPQPVPSPQPKPTENSVGTPEKQDVVAPSSPILKAQLSAPPKKPREHPKGDLKSQVCCSFFLSFISSLKLNSLYLRIFVFFKNCLVSIHIKIRKSSFHFLLSTNCLVIYFFMISLFVLKSLLILHSRDLHFVFPFVKKCMLSIYYLWYFNFPFNNIIMYSF